MTNKGTETCDYVQITATFYDANKSINVFGISPGQTQAVSDGIWYIETFASRRTQNWL